jgi:DNA polymerase III epsilon subunit-like protein
MNDITKINFIYKQLNKNFNLIINKFLEIDEHLSNIFGNSSFKHIIHNINKIFIGQICKFPSHYQLHIYHKLNNNISSNNNIFVFDIETNGFDKIIQISYIIIDNRHNIISENDFFIFNDHYTIDYYKKININTLKHKGIHPIICLNKLINDLSMCNTIIGHNIKNFDIPRLKKYSNKFNITLNLDHMYIIDTMIQSKNYVNVKNIRGHLKVPSLFELCKHCEIDIDNTQQHDGLYDVQKTLECFLLLSKKGIITYS